MKARSVTLSDLQPDELEFIKKYGIAVDEIIDVTGMIRVGQKRAMEAKGARLAINGGRCKKGHRLKTRSNHCPQCEPKNLAFERRHSTTAYVYVCASDIGLVKIGYATDPIDRERRLNREAYARCSNWRLVFKLETEKAGRVESRAQALLNNYMTAEAYDKGGVEIFTYEAFRCSEESAVEAVRRAASIA